jgi:hypothetical protein
MSKFSAPKFSASKFSGRTAALGIMSALALGSIAAAPAYAKDGGNKVAVTGTCTASSTSKIKAGHDGSVIETEFEVDTHRVGQVWNVTINDNGVRVFTGSRATAAPSGSFSVERRIANRAGTDNLVASARNTVTGETCVARVSI